MRALTRHSIAGCAIAILAPFAVVACDGGGGEPEPKFTDSSSAASTESSAATDEPSPTGPVEPTMPVEAEEATKAGAEAFVGYYIDLINYAQKTGDVGPLRRHTLDSCVPCEGGIQLVTNVYARGGRFKGGEYVTLDSKARTNVDGVQGWFVDTRVRTKAQIVEGAGDLDKTYPGGTSLYRFKLDRAGDSWLLADWDTLQ